jgi:hypothetical protein
MRLSNAMPRNVRCVLLSTVVSCAVISAHENIQAELATDDLETGRINETERLRKILDAAVDRYELFVNAKDTTRLKPHIALRWGNNERGSADALEVIWAHHGVPVATASIYPYEGNLCHTFGVCARKPGLVARAEGVIVWRPMQSGVEFEPLPSAPKPAASSRLRLQQMKSLSRRFQSTMLGWRSDDSDREELRLLPTPIYRYEPEGEGKILDGAVFAFVKGTDPENLLLLEAVREDEGSRWEYAFVRRTSGALDGRLDEKVVWKATKFPPESDPLGEFITLRERLDAALFSETAR